MPLSNAKRRIQIVVRSALAMVFLYAAAMKTLRGHEGEVPSTVFADWTTSPGVRYTAICGEVVLGAWLLTGFEINLAGIVAMAMLSAFTGLVIMDFESDHPKPCGCSGNAAAAGDPSAIRSGLLLDLVRNTFMMGGAAWLYVFAQKRKSASDPALNKAPRKAPVGTQVVPIAQSRPKRKLDSRRPLSF